MINDDEGGNWFSRLKQFLHREPTNKDELIDLLRDAHMSALIDSETLSMIEGVIQFSELRVRDIMLPKMQMVVLSQDASLAEIMHTVIDSGHSRFPVCGKNPSEIIGILHVKDLVGVTSQQAIPFDLKKILHTATVVPETQQLDLLLKECRHNRNHMVLVVDEYGTLSGFVTIEDIIEQIVGDIEDEFDDDEDDVYIKVHGDAHYMVKAHTPITVFNEQLQAHFASKYENETIGEMLMTLLGHLPKCGQIIHIDTFEFKIINADARGIKLLSCLDKRAIDSPY